MNISFLEPARNELDTNLTTSIKHFASLNRAPGPIGKAKGTISEHIKENPASLIAVAAPERV